MATSRDGSSYNNQSGLAANTSFIGVGTGHTVTDSGSGNFIGTLNAPGYDITISGQGASWAPPLATQSTSPVAGDFIRRTSRERQWPVANYAYASWFEDNSDSRARPNLLRLGQAETAARSDTTLHGYSHTFLAKAETRQ